jgi:predicted ferric reductase
VLDLRVVHVLDDPPEHWSGEDGFIDRALLERNLPPDCRTYEFFICGPDP